MRNIFFIIILSSLTFAGCGNNSSSDETHDHDSGSPHTHENNEDHQHHDTIQQQEFRVDQDSVVQNHEGHEHAGDSAHTHPH